LISDTVFDLSIKRKMAKLQGPLHFAQISTQSITWEKIISYYNLSFPN
jgi:hypothetical protein